MSYTFSEYSAIRQFLSRGAGNLEIIPTIKYTSNYSSKTRDMAICDISWTQCLVLVHVDILRAINRSVVSDSFIFMKEQAINDTAYHVVFQIS